MTDNIEIDLKLFKYKKELNKMQEYIIYYKSIPSKPIPIENETLACPILAKTAVEAEIKFLEQQNKALEKVDPTKKTISGTLIKDIKKL